MPAYATIIGAAFYPFTQAGSFVFPAQYRGRGRRRALLSHRQSGLWQEGAPFVRGRLQEDFLFQFTEDPLDGDLGEADTMYVFFAATACRAGR